MNATNDDDFDDTDANDEDRLKIPRKSAVKESFMAVVILLEKRGKKRRLAVQ